MKKKLLYGLLVFLSLFPACTPNQIISQAYTPQKMRVNNEGFIYYLPKKVLVLQLTVNLYHKVKVRQFQDGSRPAEYQLMDTYACLKDVKLDHSQTLPDMDKPIWLSFSNPKNLSNDLDATFTFKNGMLTEVRSRGTDQSGQVFSSVFNAGLSIAQLGNPLSKITGGTKGDEGFTESIVIDTVENVEIKYLYEPEYDFETKKFKNKEIELSEILPQDNMKTFETKIIVELNNNKGIEDYSSSDPFQTPNTSYTGIVYRTPLPIRTTLIVSHEQDNSLVRDRVISGVVADAYVFYPQFGMYSVLPFELNRGRDSEIVMMFDAENNTGLSSFQYKVSEKRSKMFNQIAQKADSSTIYMQMRREQELKQQIELQRLRNDLDKMKTTPKDRSQEF